MLQKCIKQLCILHPRLQSNKITVEDAEAPRQSEVDACLDPFRGNFDAAGVTKTSMVNFLRLHYRQENNERDRQIQRILEVLAMRPQGGPSALSDPKEERGEVGLWTLDYN